LDKLTEDNLKSQTTNPNNKKITITKIDNLVKSQKNTIFRHSQHKPAGNPVFSETYD